jgi:Trk K+ transport system NAD-binding subunit
VVNPGGDVVLRAGDEVLVMGAPQAVRRFCARAEGKG